MLVGAGGVAVGGTEPFRVSTSCGALAPDSRAERLMAVGPGVERPKLKVPWPLTKEVTSKKIQVPLTTAGEVSKEVSIAGWLAEVMVVSPQVLSATDWEVIPEVEAELAWMRS